ncbi:hypothetical protein [Desulfurobacterium sp.]
MNRIRQLTVKLGKNVLPRGLKEYAKLSNFYSLRKIHDFEIECDLILFEGKEEALSFSVSLKDYISRENSIKILEEIEMWITTNLSISEIENISTAMIKITSCYQLFEKPECNNIKQWLIDLETKAYTLRDELINAYFGNLDKYTFNLNVWFIPKNERYEIELFSSSDFKFIPYIYSKSQKRVKQNISNSLRHSLFLNNFKYLQETCRNEVLQIKDIKEACISLNISQETKIDWRG